MALFDLSTVVAIESLSRRGATDPWAAVQAGRLADFLIWQDEVSYVMPVKTHEVLDDAPIPFLLAELKRREENDEEYLSPRLYETRVQQEIADSALEPAFRAFEKWSLREKSAFNAWLGVQWSPWVKKGHLERVATNLVYPVDRLPAPEVRKHADRLGVLPDQVHYALDVVLRYPFYGQLAIADEPFLAHPMREHCDHPTFGCEPVEQAPVPLSFQSDVTRIASRLSAEELAILIHEIRAAVRKRELVGENPGSLGREVIRGIAEEVRLPPKLFWVKSALATSAAGLSVAAAASGTPELAAMSALVSVPSAFWNGGLPRGTPVRWVRWAVRWDIEDQADPRDT